MPSPSLRAAPFLAALALALSASAAFGQVSVTTQRYDAGRTGQNLAETILTPANVGPSTFGKLFGLGVDDEVYAQPLYVANVAIPGVGTRNVLYVATVNNSLYAFDADDPRRPSAFWRLRLNGPVPGARPVHASDVGQACGVYKDFSGNVGIVGSPVVDPVSRTLYVVARTKENGAFVQRLHAIDIATGAARPNSPVVVQASVPGTGAGSSGGVLAFNPQTENQRAALTLANNTLYVTWASHCDTGPYHGWLIGYNPTTLAQTFARAYTPNGQDGGIWQSGTGPSVDASGNLYLTLGNGTVTAPTGGQDFGNAFLKLGPVGQVLDWFIPYNYQSLNAGDVDLGSAGVLLIPNTNLLTSGGKEGKLYLLDRNNLGHYRASSDSQILQSFQVAASGRHFHSTPTFWNGPSGPHVYTWCEADFGKAFKVENDRLVTTPASQTTVVANNGMPGGFMAISANGATNGILWVSLAASGDANQDVRPGIFRAFDASDLTHELWNTAMNPARDGFGNFAKFNTPVVANGKVFLATFSKQVVVYGPISSTNAYPTVTAGPSEVTVVLPDTLALAGTASDDGAPGPLTTRWVQVSGDGVATFANADALLTTVAFSAPGDYVLRLTASDGAVATGADVRVSVLAEGAILGNGSGVTGDYYDNFDFTGTRLVRMDPTIDFNWGAGAPIAGIGANTFSVRWTGQVQAQYSESYTFTTRSDDGVRLWVNDQLVVDNWTDHSATDDSGTISLVKGQRYALKMEYYDNAGDATATLSWSSPSTPKRIVPRSQLYASTIALHDADTPGVYVASTGAWFLRNQNSAGGANAVFGYGPANAGWVPVTGDWNGDGIATVGLYDPATSFFFLKNASASGPADLTFGFGGGGLGATPLAGDWNGDGSDTIGLYEPATGAFFLKNSNSAGPADVVFQFGGGGLVPLVGDWDGDGRDSVGLYDPATGAFFLRNTATAGNAQWVFNFGPAGAVPLSGDWNGDGVDSIGIYVPATGVWFGRNTNTFGPADFVFSYGPANATPIVGDWNGQ
jgi:hypothetical protein